MSDHEENKCWNANHIFHISLAGCMMTTASAGSGTKVISVYLPHRKVFGIDLSVSGDRIENIRRA